MGDHFRDDIQLTMKIFDTVISPILTYGSEVWGVDHDGKLENDAIEFVQTKFIRWLYTVFTNGGHAGKNWCLVVKARRWRINKNCK